MLFRVCTLGRRIGRACGDLEKTEDKGKGERQAGRWLIGEGRAISSGADSDGVGYKSFSHLLAKQGAVQKGVSRGEGGR